MVGLGWRLHLTIYAGKVFRVNGYGFVPCPIDWGTTFYSFALFPPHLSILNRLPHESLSCQYSYAGFRSAGGRGGLTHLVLTPHPIASHLREVLAPMLPVPKTISIGFSPHMPFLYHVCVFIFEAKFLLGQQTLRPLVSAPSDSSRGFHTLFYSLQINVFYPTQGVCESRPQVFYLTVFPFLDVIDERKFSF